jgi:hypothetical protein
MADFGIRSFRIKSFTPKELNLEQFDLQDYVIERRQRYFHIARIPVFGLGKIWRLRKDGELYKPDPLLLNLLDLCNIKVKTPWYTYGFPILAALVATIVFSVILIKDLSSNYKDNKEYKEKRELIINKIESPSVFDYWKVENTDQHNDILLKVVKFDKEGLSFIGLEQQYSYNHDDWEIRREFSDTTIYDTIYVRKDSLMLAIKEDRTNQTWNTGVFFGKNRCKIGSIIRIDKPFLIGEFNWVAPKDYSESYLELRNRGLKCQLDSVLVEGKKIEIDANFPTEFNYNQAIRLSENKLKYEDLYNVTLFAYYRDEHNKGFVSEIAPNKDGLWFDSEISSTGKK